MTRDQWIQAHTECMVPDCGGIYAGNPGMWTLETHEIARGVFRQAALKVPAAWLRVCKHHHYEMGDYSIWPIARQLAVKKLADRPNYCRVTVNRLRDKEDEAITEAEVDAWVERMTQ